MSIDLTDVIVSGEPKPACAVCGRELGDTAKLDPRSSQGGQQRAVHPECLPTAQEAARLERINSLALQRRELVAALLYVRDQALAHGCPPHGKSLRLVDAHIDAMRKGRPP